MSRKTSTTAASAPSAPVVVDVAPAPADTDTNTDAVSLLATIADRDATIAALLATIADRDDTIANLRATLDTVAPSADPADPAVASMIGRYRVGAKLGKDEARSALPADPAFLVYLPDEGKSAIAYFDGSTVGAERTAVKAAILRLITAAPSYQEAQEAITHAIAAAVAVNGSNRSHGEALSAMDSHLRGRNASIPVPGARRKAASRKVGGW